MEYATTRTQVVIIYIKSQAQSIREKAEMEFREIQPSVNVLISRGVIVLYILFQNYSVVCSKEGHFSSYSLKETES